MAKRYGKLPSEVLDRGSSIDFFCADLSVKYDSYLNIKAQKKADGKVDHNLKTEDLQSMLNSVRKKGKDGTKQ